MHKDTETKMKATYLSLRNVESMLYRQSLETWAKLLREELADQTTEITIPRKTLQGLITLLDEIEQQSEGQYPHKAPHCILCTEGATPDKYNTGLCALHMAKELLKGAK